MPEISVFVEPLLESNCYILAQGNVCVVIDPNGTDGPQALLSRHHWTPEWILLTHEHCDHMAGLEAMRERYPQARVLASEACSAGIQSARLNMSRMMEVYLTFSGKPDIHYPPFTCRAADVTFPETYTLDWRGRILRFISLPGHTSGSTGILLDDSVFFSGDYLLPDNAAVLRLPGGSVQDYELKTKPFLERLPDGIWIYPGHGAPYRLTGGARHD